MKVKVMKIFRDKHTNIYHEPNEELEVTKKRFEEINSTSFGVFVEEIKEDSQEEHTEKPDENEKSGKQKKRILSLKWK